MATKITVPAGAMRQGTDFFSLAIPAIAQGVQGILAGKKELEATTRSRALEDLSNLIQLHGPAVVDQPEFGDLYQKIYGKPWPKTQVNIPAVTEQQQVPVERVMPLQGKYGEVAAGPSETRYLQPEGPGIQGMPQKTVTGTEERKVEISPARTEERPSPLGGVPQFGAELLQVPALQALGRPALESAGVPQGMWNQRIGDLVKVFPQLGQNLFDIKSRMQSEKDEAKFLHQLLLGDLSRLSPSQLRMALQRYNSLIQSNPDLGLQAVDPSIAKQMIEESINYQLGQGRMSLMQAQVEMAKANAESIRSLTPERIQLIRAQIYKIQALTPVQQKYMDAKMQEALAKVKFMVENQGMDPYQAAKLAQDAFFKTQDDKRMLIALYGNLAAGSQKLDAFGSLVTIPEVAALKDQVGVLAAPIIQSMKPYVIRSGPNSGQTVTFDEMAKFIGQARSSGMDDQTIAERIKALGIAVDDFLMMLPGFRNTRGR